MLLTTITYSTVWSSSVCASSIMLVALAVVFLSYLFYKAFLLYNADGDLQVMGSKLKPDYFKGRVVWVTGASSGIGEEMCYQLSKLGAKLIMSARNEEKMEKVKSSLAEPENARILVLDLSDPVAVRKAAEKAKQLFGRIDMLVNNGGISMRSLFVDLKEEVHRRIMEINLFAPWILTHDTLPVMLSGGFGHIVNISSIWGKAGPTNRTSYAATKFGIIGMMDSLRLEMTGKNIFITNVVPGPVKTQAGANAVTADGSAVGFTDKLVAAGMTVERCVELILIAMCNHQRELWVSPQPWLMIPYLAHYFPWLLNYWLTKRAIRELKAAGKIK